MQALRTQISKKPERRVATMWERLPVDNRTVYKRLILAFAYLSELFEQKASADNSQNRAPIVNSKYQETVFQKAFNAVCEDNKNTSYDASLVNVENGVAVKYLVGIKTFGIESGLQKIAQFKTNHNQWADLIQQMNSNVKDCEHKTKADINTANKELYLRLAKEVASLRNDRIDSSIAQIKGFEVAESDKNLESVYHVLMSSKSGETPQIYVGETDYDKIDIENIEVCGCTKSKNPTNFTFSDGKHKYEYTSADSQLLMDFDNKNIVQETWDVQYAPDAFEIISGLADKFLSTSEIEDVKQIIQSDLSKNIKESYSWMIKIERASGYNSFYGAGSKLGIDDRQHKIDKISETYKDNVNTNVFCQVIEKLKVYLLANNKQVDKFDLRENILCLLKEQSNSDFTRDVKKLLYRPKNEIYIPIPNSREFHDMHPDFFGKSIGTFKDNSDKLAIDDKEKRSFTLVFEPSGAVMEAFITQANGKAIQSLYKQSELGKWLLRGVFQLKEYELLTQERLNELEINGIRLYKTELSDDIHLEFVWIDEDNKPKDCIN